MSAPRTSRELIAAGGVVTLALVAGFVAAEELPFFHLTTENQGTPLPSGSVQKLLQDSQGYVWMGFYSTGVARFDGRGFESFGTEDGLADLVVRELVQDDLGHLWVGSESGLVVSERPLPGYAVNERVRFVSRVGDVDLVRGRVRHGCLVAASPATVWVGAGHSAICYRWEAGGALTEEALDAPPGPGGLAAAASAVHAGADGAVLLGLLDGRLLWRAPGTTTLVELPAAGDPLLSLHQRDGGPLWAGFGSGAVGRFRAGPAPGFEIVSRALTERIVEIRQRQDGAIWVVSLGDGLLLLEPSSGREAHYTRRDGLIGETMWSILEDREGNTWFAQNGGVSRLRSDFRAFGRVTGSACAEGPPALPDPTVFSALPGRGSGFDGLMWVGTGGGLTAVSPGGETASIGVSQGLASTSVYGLGRDAAGLIWVATVNGLNVLSAGQLPAHPAGTERSVELLGQRVRLTQIPLGLLYTCTPLRIAPAPGLAATEEVMVLAGTSGVVLYHAGRWHQLRAAAGLPPSGATCSAIDGDGHLWVGTSDTGLLRTDAPVTAAALAEWQVGGADPAGREVAHGVLSSPETLRGVLPPGILTLAWAEGRLWVGTESGLWGVGGSPPRVELHLDRAGGLGGSTVRGVVWSPRWQTLWVSQGGGLAEVDPRSGAVRRLVTKSDGLVENEAWASAPLAVAADGTVLLGSPKGLSLYRPDLDTSSEVPPRMALRRAVVTETGGGHNEVVFEFAALSFTDESRVRFRTRLRGYDPEWSEPTAESRIRYTNLPAIGLPRTYVFELLAASSDGVWSPEPLRHAFSIRPPWWLAWWSQLAYGLGFLVAVVGFHRVRAARLHRRARELEEEVGRRTAEIEAQAHELETLERIVRVINQEVVLERVLQALLDQGMTLFPQAEKALFAALDAATGSFQVRAVSGWDVGSFSGYSLSAAEALRRYAERADRIQEGVFIVRDLAGRPGADRLSHLPTPKAMLTMAVTIQDTVEGFMVFDNFSDPLAFDKSDLRRLTLFRQHAISAIQKARMVRELEDANRDALQASKAKSAFLATMSHELRTPLNSIIGFSEILLSRLRPSIAPRYAKFLENINVSGQHLLGIINDILDISKIEAGRMELHFETVELGAIVDGVCAIMRTLAGRKAITLDVRIEEGMPAVEADGPKVKQVLYNLLSNAVKFSPQGSAILVESRRLAATESPLGVEGVVLVVEDHGIGIAPEEQARVFEEFYQTESSLRQQAGGTGLGLALVERFVDMHGGRVLLDSEPGRGSRFTVVLPLRPPSPELPTDAGA